MNKKIEIVRPIRDSSIYEIFPERNKQIYLETMGFDTVDDQTPVKKPLTLNEAGAKYGLSRDRIYRIKAKYKKRYLKSVTNVN